MLRPVMSSSVCVFAYTRCRLCRYDFHKTQATPGRGVVTVHHEAFAKRGLERGIDANDLLTQVGGIELHLAHTENTWLPDALTNGDDKPATLQQVCRPRSIMPFFGYSALTVSSIELAISPGTPTLAVNAR